MGQPDVTQCRRDSPRHVELRWLSHRSADVEHQVNREVTLFVEETQQEPVQSLIGFPIDMPVVVAGGVGPMIGELEASSALRREPVGAVLSRQRPLGDHVQVLELLEEIVFEPEGHRSLAIQLPASSSQLSADGG